MLTAPDAQRPYEAEPAHAAAPQKSADAATEPARVTPMMAQYIEIKAVNPDCLLFYRMGDFYELFFGDAEIASRALGIVLTKRGKHAGNDIPMCGVPIDRADDYLQRLIALGHRVAVCEQMEDPAEARKRGPKSVVRRDVVRLVTPGTITEERLLEPGRANVLLALARVRASDDEWTIGLAAADISTGAFALSETSEAGLAAEIARIDPSEIVAPEAFGEEKHLRRLLEELRAPFTLTARGASDVSAERRLTDFYGVRTLDGFGALTRAEIAAGANLVAYVERTQIGVRPPLGLPTRLHRGATMEIDAATRANLELTRTLSGQREGSLLACIDMTVTPAGGRALAERIAAPLTDVARIAARLDAVALFVEAPDLRAQLRAALKSAPDMARALSRLALGRG
ncbi:MAG: mismatch repair protein MutS, partial [Hyphomicrobiales bacterium]|nr:mismatch repair protein MutS [Hyphomicrobiales bacterium]